MRSPMRSASVSSRTARSASPCGVLPCVGIIRGDEGGQTGVVARIEDKADGVECPSGWLARSQIVENHNFRSANRFKDTKLGGFAARVITCLNVFEQLAVIAKEALMATADEFFEAGDGEMRFANAGWAHPKKATFTTARIFGDETLGEHFGSFEGRGVLRVFADVGAVTFEIAMLVPLGNARAVNDARGAFFHAAIARSGHGPGGIRTRNHLPTGAAAKLTVLKSHRKKAYGRAKRTAS
jgi:hypothetical protein